MRRSERSGAIVVLDVDKFKPVNDVFGHAAGDELPLRWVVHELSVQAAWSDPVTRSGVSKGDEFAIVLLPEIGADDARDLTTRIGEALAERAPCSLGVALYPRDGDDLEDADAAWPTARLYGMRRGRYEREQAHGAAAAPAEVAASRRARSRRLPSAHGCDLWRAALDAMPSRAGARRSGRLRRR